MSEDKIAEIRKRHETGERASADADREWLLAEVERLTRERDEARATAEERQRSVVRMRAEVERLEAENKRLRVTQASQGYQPSVGPGKPPINTPNQGSSGRKWKDF